MSISICSLFKITLYKKKKKKLARTLKITLQKIWDQFDTIIMNMTSLLK